MNEGVEPTAESVLRLARVLAREQGDDVAQRAWVAAVERRIPVAELRGWLQGAVRRLSRSARREEARRAERELVAARTEAIEGAAETLERLEAAHELVRAVRELPEPFRTALVLRFFGELPPREIARRTGVPVNTARSRVRRGIEELRRRLPSGALFTLVPRRQLTAPAAPWLVGTGAALGAVVLVAALRPREGALPAEPVAPAPVAATVESLGTRPARPALDSAGVREPLPASTPAAPAVVARAGDSDLVHIRGRLVDPRGRALAGIVLELEELHVLRSGDPRLELPDEWTRPRTASASDGRFELAFTAPEAYAFGLSIAPAGCAPLRWFWPRLVPGTVLELGELAFAPEARVTGRVLGGSGEPRVGEALTLLFEPAREPEPPLEWPAFECAVDPESASFLLAGLPDEAGTLRLLAPSGRVLAERAHAPRAGLAEELDLVVAEPSASQWLTLAVRAPFGLMPDAAALRVDSAAIDVRRIGSSFELGPLGAGTRTLTLDDPRFLPWRHEAAEPGARLVAELVGSATLALVVRAPDGALVRDFELELEFLCGEPGVALFTTRSLRRPGRELVDGELPGLVPGDYRLAVRAGALRAHADLTALESGERRTLTLPLGTGESARGRCLFADGAPAAGVVLSALVPGSPDDRALSILRRGWHVAADALVARREFELVRTDADGAFHFELLGAGRYLVACLDEHGRVRAELSFQVSAGEALAGLELVLPSLDSPEPPR